MVMQMLFIGKNVIYSKLVSNPFKASDSHKDCWVQLPVYHLELYFIPTDDSRFYGLECEYSQFCNIYRSEEFTRLKKTLLQIRLKYTNKKTKNQSLCNNFNWYNEIIVWVTCFTNWQFCNKTKLLYK